MMAVWKGVEVFKNTNCTGKTDLILNIDGQLVQIDVKLAQWHKANSCWHCRDASRVEFPVYPVVVEPDGDIMNWKIRWKKNKQKIPCCPLGLEDFWSKSSTHV